ncbi:MAG: NAD-dependent epimerase/dehydratase family protein [Rhodocyclaceae bacterium]|jgi:nucleoside-diphosphate-sugar epimerase|nr:NAD-dependent epimerase/dehydratase family protein [Rhodocyclaceae bacterium]
MQGEKPRGCTWRSICVTGATSQLATFLLPRLIESGIAVHAFSRNPPVTSTAGVDWYTVDIGSGAGLPVIRAEGLLHLATIWLLPPRIGDFAALGVGRIVAFSSTSRFTKIHSRYAGERRLAEKLAQAETRFAKECDRYGIGWTVLRPTLIYGGGNDLNVTRIASFVRRFGFFPVAGPANGLRQPVHAADLAAACLAALDSPAALQHGYNLSGGEALTYRNMVAVIFRAQGRTPRIIQLPLFVWRLAAYLSRMSGSGAAINMGMVHRMNEDLVFDNAEARRDLGYAPRAFWP